MSESMSTSRRAAWRRPELQRLLSAALTSSLATGIFLGSLPLAVAARGGSPLDIGIASAALFAWWIFSIPLSLPTDRFGAGPVLRIMAPLRILGVLLIAAHMLLPGRASIIAIIVGALIYGFVDVVNDTAVNTLPSLIVDEDEYDEAYSSLQAVTMSADLIIGPGIGGLLFALGEWLPFVIAAVSLLGAYFLLMPYFNDARTQGPERVEDDSDEEGWWAATTAGLRHAMGNKVIRGIAITLIGIAIVEEIVSVSMAPYMRDGSGTDAWPQLLGVVRAAAGVLAVAAALLVPLVGRRFTRERVMAVVAIGGSLSGAILSIAPVWVAVFAAVAVSRIAEAMWVPLAQSSIMSQTEPHLRGRTRAAVMFIIWGTLPVASLLGGGLATALGIRPLLLAGSVVALLTCAIGIPAFARRQPSTPAASGDMP